MKFQVLIGILTIAKYWEYESEEDTFQVLIGILTILLKKFKSKLLSWVSSPYRYSNNYAPLLTGGDTALCFKSL